AAERSVTPDLVGAVLAAVPFDLRSADRQTNRPAGLSDRRADRPDPVARPLEQPDQAKAALAARLAELEREIKAVLDRARAQSASRRYAGRSGAPCCCRRAMSCSSTASSCWPASTRAGWRRSVGERFEADDCAGQQRAMDAMAIALVARGAGRCARRRGALRSDRGPAASSPTGHELRSAADGLRAD